MHGFEKRVGALTALVVVGACLAYSAPVLSDTLPSLSYNHCVLYNAAGCPGANTTSKAITSVERSAPKPLWAAQAGKGPAQYAIDLNNICRWVDNASGNTTTDLFVPFKTDTEWGAFITSAGTAGSSPSQIVSLFHCSRPSTAQSSVGIPPNDPNIPPSDSSMLCYDKDGKLQTANQAYFIAAYGRVGEQRTINDSSLTAINFPSCYTQNGQGPWIKTVISAAFQGLDADRLDGNGGSTKSSANSDWKLLAVNYGAPVPGVCGSANNLHNLSSPPLSNELCVTGIPTTISGTGSPSWTWTCQGLNGDASANCSASTQPPVCPAVVSWSDWGNQSTWPDGGGNTYLTFTGVTNQVDVQADTVGSYGSTGAVTSYFSGKCSLTVNGSNGSGTSYTVDDEDEGQRINQTLNGDPSTWWWLQSTAYYDFIQCIADEYASQSLPGYQGCTGSVVTGNAASPLKVNLARGDAVMNSTTPTAFYLTLQDGRTLEGHVKGGLNADEGWLMVRRSADPLVFDNGALNANDWFGDRDHRSLNGYADLAETFKDFVVKDEYGQNFIPLHVLNDQERKAKAGGDHKVTDPSFDLRVVDVDNVEHFASDYFDRIYVDYRSVVEGDGPRGRDSNNIILERGIVRTVAGENHAAIDQWFILDLPAGYAPTSRPTQSKVWPAPAAKQ